MALPFCSCLNTVPDHHINPFIVLTRPNTSHVRQHDAVPVPNLTLGKPLNNVRVVSFPNLRTILRWTVEVKHH